MIKYPMECRSADHSIESAGKGKLQQIGRDQLGSLAELRSQVFQGRPRHVLGNVESNHASTWQRL